MPKSLEKLLEKFQGYRIWHRTVAKLNEGWHEGKSLAAFDEISLHKESESTGMTSQLIHTIASTVGSSIERAGIIRFWWI